MKVKIILHILSALSALAVCSSSLAAERMRGADQERTRIKTCVEVQKTEADIQNRCFKIKADYRAWKACVKKTGNRVKCYVKKKPVATPPVADAPVVIPPEEHFRFSYAFVEMTPEQASPLNGAGLRKIAMQARTICVFEARDLYARLALPTLHIDAVPPPPAVAETYELQFDVETRLGTNNCARGEASVATFTFFQIPLGKGIFGFGLVKLTHPDPTVYYFRTSPAYVAFALTASNQREPLMAEVEFRSYANNVAAGTFAFLAKLPEYSSPTSAANYLIVFDGTFRLQNKTPPP